jgi:peptidoglycan/LPS O-acetylase OafA/YrhL
VNPRPAHPGAQTGHPGRPAPAPSRRLRLGWRVDGARAPRPHGLRAGHYPAIDLLRGFAAVSVVLYHFLQTYRWPDPPFPAPVLQWLNVGWIGVDLFFVISGLVITLSAIRLREKHPEDFAKLYLRRRLARIVPLHYATCLFYLLFLGTVMLVRDRALWMHIATHLTFTHNLFLETNQSINPPNWTLGIEVQFYLLVLLGSRWLVRMKPLALLLGAIAFAWAWRGACLALTWGQMRGPVNLTWFSASQLGGVLDEFAMGSALALLIHRDAAGRAERVLVRLRWLVPVAAAGLSWLVLDLLGRAAGDFWTSPAMVIGWRTLLGVTCALWVLAACLFNHPRLMHATAPLRYLGTISYGIYLWHWLVLMALKPHLKNVPAKACALSLALTIGLAALSWHFFEKPFLQRKSS